MDKKTSMQVRVGVFVTLGLVLTMVVIFLLGGTTSFFKSNYKLHSRFENINGLRMGAAVYLAGITVGSVDRIQFPEDLKQRDVIVHFKIASEFKDRIRQDSTAVIATQGLLGDKVILISVGTPETPELKNGDLLATKKDAFSLESFAEKGGDLMNEVKDLIQNLKTITGDLKEKDSFLHALIYDPKGKEVVSDFRGVAASANQLMRDIKNGKGILNSLIYSKEGANLPKDLSIVAENLKKTSQNFNEVSSKIEKGEGSVGGLINDPTVYYDLKTLMGKANRSKLIQAVVRYTLNKNEKETLK
ncbi:MAG: MCE family protein [Deltaproteobacteria bacterium]|nr:MCE family protein [Deltaproteobacteria bacterium]